MATTLLDLLAKLRLDSSEYEDGIEDAENKANSLGNKLKSGLGTAAKVGAAAVGAFSAAATAIGKQSLEAYADYEQLQGGVETLFKGSANAVMENAARAYETAGLSANQYMETVTGFASALIQSTGRGAQTNLEEMKRVQESELKETKRNLQDQYDALKEYWDNRIKLAQDSGQKEALRDQRDEQLKKVKRAHEDLIEEIKRGNEEALKEAEAANQVSIMSEESLERAAQLADVAIQDMSDNANKMGTDMAAIQNAYQGFAKQNYTMLDNLKLGYGGTKEEMKRLLEDAERIKAKNGEIVEYSINSYADIIEAIHVIQTEMGITGTTAEEASKTIQGSVNAMKAAWKNLLVGMADENANIDDLITKFVDSVETAGNNIIPRIEKILDGAAKVITYGVEKLVPLVVKVIVDNLPMMVESGIRLAVSLARGLVEATPQIIAAIPEIIASIKNVLVENWEDIKATVKSLVGDEVYRIIEYLAPLAPAILGAVATFKAFTTVGSFIETAITAVKNIMTVVQGLFTLLMANPIALIIAAIVGLISYLVILYNTNEEFRDKVNAAWASVKEFVSAAIERIKADFEVLKASFIALKEAISQRIEEIKAAFESFKEKARQVVESIREAWANAKQSGANLVSNIRNGISEKASELIDGIAKIVTTVRDAFVEGWKNAKTIGSNLLANIQNGVSEKASDLSNRAAEIASAVRDVVSKTWAGAKTIGSNFTTALRNGFAEKISDFSSVASKAAVGIRDIFSKAWEGARVIGSNLIAQIGNGVSEKVSVLGDAIQKIASSIGDALKRFADSARILGGNISLNIRNGFAEKVRDMYDIIRNMFREIQNAFRQIIDAARSWGSGLMASFCNGIVERWNDLVSRLNQMAQAVRDRLHFTQPDKGPLSGPNGFESYAPDMMKTFAKGIKDNTSLVTDQIEKSFDFSDSMAGFDSGTVVSRTNTRTVSNVPRNTTVIMQIGRTEFGRLVYEAYNEEAQRVGVKLATGGLV